MYGNWHNFDMLEFSEGNIKYWLILGEGGISIWGRF
jgi:hypothetical protein